MIVSAQRQAIESLVEFLRPVSLRAGQRFFLEGREIYYCGTSPGRWAGGAAIDGLDVAGFCDCPPDPRRPSLPPAIQQVGGAVLLRTARAGEGRPVARDRTAREAVESLYLIGIHGNFILFARDGAKAIYPVLATSAR